MKKALALILASLMCLSILVSCGETNTDDPASTTTGNAGEVTTTEPIAESPYDANGYLKDSLDPDLDYTGKTFTLLYWSDVERHEFEVEEITGDLIDDALYNRNMAVESRLGVKLQWDSTKGNYDNQANFVSKITNDVNSGGTYDVFAGYSMTSATIALNGLSRDLMTVANLDFEKPWWPESLTSQATINGRLYFCSGDISTNMLHMMYCTLFNKNLAADYQMGDMYKLVRDGEWTFDKLIELCQGTYRDLNGNNTKDLDDQFGFGCYSMHHDAIFIGAGFRTIEKDENTGLPIVSPSFGSSEVQDLLVKMLGFIYDTEDAYSNGINSDYRSANALRDNKLIFTLDRVYITSGTLKDVSDFEVGILPTPKGDVEQENYVTTEAFPFSTYSMSNALSQEQADLAGAVLECMGSEGYRQVSPALFETSMKLKYASGQDDSDMYDLIRETVYMDLGRIFCTPLSNLTYSIFRNCCTSNNTNWATQFKANSKPLNKLLDTVVTKLESIAANQ